MMVRVVRVACLPGGLSMFVDEQPASMVIWVLKEDYSEDQVAMWESALNSAIGCEARKPIGRAVLRAV